MAYKIPPILNIERALREEGFPLPDDCADVRLLMSYDGPYQLLYIINLTSDQLEKVGRALVKVAQEKQ